MTIRSMPPASSHLAERPVPAPAADQRFAPPNFLLELFQEHATLESQPRLLSSVIPGARRPRHAAFHRLIRP